MPLLFYRQRLQELTQSLPIIDPFEPLTSINRSLQLCQQTISAVINHLHYAPFPTVADQVQFNKELYPLFYSQLFYFWTLKVVHLEIPSGLPEAKIDFLSKQLGDIDRYRNDQHVLYSYMLSGDTMLDEHFFQFDTTQYSLYEATISRHPILPFGALSLLHPSSITGRLLAGQLTIDYITAWLERLTLRGPITDAKAHKLVWTESKAALVELLYALQEFGVFNNSKQEISKVAAYFTQVFGIPLGNIYKTYESIRIRKKNRTPFLEGLKTALLRRMDSDDLHAL